MDIFLTPQESDFYLQQATVAAQSIADSATQTSESNRFTFFAAFDGTRNASPPENGDRQDTAINELSTEVKNVSPPGTSQHANYYPGVGTSDTIALSGSVPVQVTLQSIINAQDAYNDFLREASDWYQLHNQSSFTCMIVGFSRGCASEAIFAQMLYENGLIFTDSNGITHTLIAPGSDEAVSAALAIDPVLTGEGGNMDFPPGVENFTIVRAENEYRTFFKAADYGDDGQTTIFVPGDHSDAGDAYDSGLGGIYLGAYTNFFRNAGLNISVPDPSRAYVAGNPIIIHKEVAILPPYDVSDYNPTNDLSVARETEVHGFPATTTGDASVFTSYNGDLVVSGTGYAETEFSRHTIVLLPNSSAAISGGDDTITIDDGATLSLNGSIANNDTINLTTNSRFSLSTPETFLGTINGFIDSDTIDLTGIGLATSATIDSGNNLTVLESSDDGDGDGDGDGSDDDESGSGNTFTLQLGSSLDYTGHDLVVSSDGNGGTDIAFGPAPSHTITFSEFPLGTVNPEYDFSDNAVTVTGEIRKDVSQPGSPAAEANDKAMGPVYIEFAKPVTHAQFLAGYFNNLKSTTIEFIGPGDQVLESLLNTSLGIVPYSYTNADGISAIQILDSGTDAAGFSVDTIEFSSDVIPPVDDDTVDITPDDEEEPPDDPVYTFTVTRSGNISGASTVGYAVTGTGTNPLAATDLTSRIYPTGQVSFAPGQGGQTVTVNVLGGFVAKNPKTFAVTLFAPSLGTAIGQYSAVQATTLSPPAISNTVAGQQTSDTAAIRPLAMVTVTDPNANQTETVTVTLSSGANGTLSNLGNGSFDTVAGVYTTTGSAAAVTAALEGLVFTPTVGQVPFGQTVTTGFAIEVVDTANAFKADTSTNVVATAAGSFSTSGGTGTGTAPGISTATVSMPVFRFFDTNTGAEFLTSSASEQATVLATRPDLISQGTGFTALGPASGDPNAMAVYRFFDTRLGTHFYTESGGERDMVLATRPDLTFEGTAFYEDATLQSGTTPVYRFFDSGTGGHFYTASGDERASILSTRPDLISEGVAFYAPSAA